MLNFKDRAEFDTSEPPWQSFNTLRTMCDILSQLGCGDYAKQIAKAANLLSRCKPAAFMPVCAAQWGDYWHEIADMGDSSLSGTPGQDAQAVVDDVIAVDMLSKGIKEFVHDFTIMCEKALREAVDKEKFQDAISVKTVRVKVSHASHECLQKIDTGIISNTIVDVENFFKNMLEDIITMVCPWNILFSFRI